MIQAGTPSDLEEALTEEFNTLFADQTFMNSIGHPVRLKAFTHALPVREGEDETPDDADLPELYIVSEIQGGRQDDENDAHVVTVAAVICVCDDNTARNGHKDVLSIIRKITERFCKNPVLSHRFVFKYPLEWSLSEEDTYPYYYGGLLMKFEVPAIEKEDELA